MIWSVLWGVLGTLCFATTLFLYARERRSHLENGSDAETAQAADPPEQDTSLRSWQTAALRDCPDAICIMDVDGRVRYLSDSAYRMLGMDRNAEVVTSLSELHSKRHRTVILEEGIPAAIKQGVWVGWGDLIQSDGEPVVTEQTLFPLRDGAGSLVGIGSLIRDATKKAEAEKQAEQQMKLQEFLTCFSLTFTHTPGENFDTLIHNAMVLLAELLGTDRLLILEDNAPRRRFTGRYEVKKEGDGHCVGRVFDYRTVLDTCRAIMGLPFTFYQDVDLLCEPVRRFFPDCRSVMLIPLHVEGGTFGVMACMTTEGRADWSETEINMARMAAGILTNALARHLSEKSVKNAERTLRAILDTVPCGITWKDMESRFLGVNRTFAQCAGVDEPESLLGQTDADVFENDVTERHGELERQVMETGETLLHQEEQLIFKNGYSNWSRVSKVLVNDDKGKPKLLLSVYDDITERRRQDAELKSARLRAEEASRAKGDFLSQMSHEIRTPLNAIIGMTKIGQSSQEVNRMQSCLEKIDGASKHLLGLVNDILDMSKIEANKLTLVREAYDFEGMLENICNVISVKAEEKELVLFVNLDTDCPRAVLGDELRLSQVITNLLSNAVKFTPERGSIYLSIGHKLLPDGKSSEMSIEVRDTGIGIAPEQQSRLFQAFEQADGSITRRFGGTGLGLAISKSIMELMGGRIEMRSEEGKGSAFTIHFTLEHSATAHRHEKPDSSLFKDLRVLVVDDSHETLGFFTRTLMGFGITCDTVDNGAVAVEMAQRAHNRRKPYDIIFVDYLMEGLDGIETSRRIRQMTGQSTHIIMVSMLDWSNIENEARAVGVAGFLNKPLFQSAIFNLINEFVHGGPVRPADIAKTVACEKVFSQCRLLLVEDMEINREIALALLEDTQIEIECVENGLEAVAVMQERPEDFDVILMDVQMPVMDGLEATRRIRALGTLQAKSIPIIAMTANAFREDVLECKEAGMNDHVSKPIDTDELTEKIELYLAGKQDRVTAGS